MLNRFVQSTKALLKSAGLAGLLLLTPALCSASLLIEKAGGDLTVTAFFDGANFTFDVRGQVLLGVEDPAVPIPLTGVTIGDVTGGTDPNANVLAFGNSFMLVADGTPGLALISFFDFANVAFAGPTLTVPVYFGPLVGTPAPGSALEALTLGSPIPFSFDFVQTVNLGQGSLTQWSLSDVPEPATASYALISLVGLAAFARVRRQR